MNIEGSIPHARQVPVERHVHFKPQEKGDSYNRPHRAVPRVHFGQRLLNILCPGRLRKERVQQQLRSLSARANTFAAVVAILKEVRDLPSAFLGGRETFARGNIDAIHRAASFCQSRAEPEIPTSSLFEDLDREGLEFKASKFLGRWGSDLDLSESASAPAILSQLHKRSKLQGFEKDDLFSSGLTLFSVIFVQFRSAIVLELRRIDAEVEALKRKLRDSE